MSQTKTNKKIVLPLRFWSCLHCQLSQLFSHSHSRVVGQWYGCGKPLLRDPVFADVHFWAHSHTSGSFWFLSQFFRCLLQTQCFWSLQKRTFGRHEDMVRKHPEDAEEVFHTNVMCDPMLRGSLIPSLLFQDSRYCLQMKCACIGCMVSPSEPLQASWAEESLYIVVVDDSHLQPARGRPRAMLATCMVILRMLFLGHCAHCRVTEYLFMEHWQIEDDHEEVSCCNLPPCILAPIQETPPKGRPIGGVGMVLADL